MSVNTIVQVAELTFCHSGPLHRLCSNIDSERYFKFGAVIVSGSTHAHNSMYRRALSRLCWHNFEHIIEGWSIRQYAGIIDTLLSIIGLKCIDRIHALSLVRASWAWCGLNIARVIATYRKVIQELSHQSRPLFVWLKLILFMGIMWA